MSHRTRSAPPLRLVALCALAWTLPAQAQPGRFRAIASSATHACAIDGDGTLECRGTTPGTPPPGRFRAVGVGLNHDCAIREDGTVACWGASGPRCDDTRAPAGSFTALAAGPNYTCAIRADQTVSCWGCQDYVRPPAGRFLAISAGDSHACGIAADHGVVCWGEDEGGKANPPPGRFLAVAAGHRRSCALREDGSLTCWGEGAGDPPVKPGERFRAIAVGGSNTCALRDDQVAICWRPDERPRVADPASPAAGQARVQADGRPFQAISVNRERAWGLTAEGSVLCLGDRKVCGPWYHRSTRPSPGSDSGSDSVDCRIDVQEIGARLGGLLDEAAGAPWAEGFRAPHGRPPRVAIGSVDRGGEVHSSTFKAELARIHEAIAANGKVVPLECSFEFERFDARGHHYREDCRWDAEQRFDVQLPDFVLDFSLEPTAPPTNDPGGSSRLHAVSLAVRDAASRAIAWSRREEVALACRPRPPAVAHRSPWRLGPGLGLRLAAEVGSPSGEGDDRHYLGLTAGAFPLRYRLGCSGSEFRHCNYAILGGSASPWPRWFSVDAGLLELGMFTGSATLGALIQPAGDGATRYGVHANAFVGLGPLATVGLGLRAWAMVSPPGEVGVRLTLDLAFHDYGDFGR